MSEIHVIAVMLTLYCSGHTNAQCYPVLKQYPTLAECEKARGPKYDTYRAHVRPEDETSVCFKVVQ